jgi:hypothetical protein
MSPPFPPARNALFLLLLQGHKSHVHEATLTLLLPIMTLPAREAGGPYCFFGHGPDDGDSRWTATPGARRYALRSVRVIADVRYHPVLTCPYCGKRAMGWWRKLWPKPGPWTCASCGMTLDLSFWGKALAIALPLAGTFVFSLSAFYSVWTFVIGAIFSLVAVQLFVPFVRSDT